MLLTEFHRLVNEALPPQAAVHGDAIGLQVESRRQSANRVLVALELTDEVLAEAQSSACDVVLVFHPLIYSPLKRVSLIDRVGRLVSDLVRADIALIVVHTSFDALPHGTNAILAEKLNVDISGTLVPSEDGRYGMGIVGSFGKKMTTQSLVSAITQICGGPVRYTPAATETVTTCAIVAGSGMSFFADAVSAGVDVFITADVKYHDFHAANGIVGLIDPGHFEMEKFVPAGIVRLLESSAASMPKLLVSTVNTNPVRYSSPLPHDHSLHQIG